MFQKIADSEAANVLDGGSKVRFAFDRLGRDEASELEILRTAKDAGLSLKGLRLSDFTEVGPNGTLRLKR